jgi:hypothetical protein
MGDNLAVSSDGAEYSQFRFLWRGSNGQPEIGILTKSRKDSLVSGAMERKKSTSF